MQDPTVPDEVGTPDQENKQAIFAAIIDSSEDAIISKDLDGNITSWNRAAERMFGYAAHEVIGRHVSLLIPADKLSEEDMIIARIRNGLRVEPFTTVRVARNGSLIPISLTVSPIRTQDGRIIGASKIARDITNELKAQRELEAHARTQELLLSAGSILAANLDLQSILQKVTDITTQLSGAQFGAFFYNMVNAGGDSFWLYTLSGDGISKDAFRDFPVHGRTPLFRPTFDGDRIVRSDDITNDPRYGRNPPFNGMPPGHLAVSSYMALPVSSPKGGTIGGLFFGHSARGVFTAEHEKLISGIAAQAGTAVDNAKLYEEIRLLSGKKDEFIGVAGHELRTPITTIKGYLQLLEGEVSEDSLAKLMTAKALRQVNRLNRLVNDLLDVSKIQAGKLEYNMISCFLLPLVRESLETVRQIYSSHRIDAELPEQDIIVTVDASKIEQVLINFLTNAIKYSPGAEKILLSVKKVDNLVVISVRDWGIGIDSPHLGRIFQRYYRVHPPEHAIGGLGIGLYIAKQIVERHGGNIWVESEVDKGSVFYFCLPLPD